LLSYFLDRNNEIKNVYEKNLDLYINDVKTNSVIQENFWYVDGNSRPYSVTPETQEYINANYQIDRTIEFHDAWAKHFVSKKAVDPGLEVIKLNRFNAAEFDGSGNMLFFENKKYTYPTLFLDKGNYEILIKGKSLPDQKLNNDNAKINIILNQKIIKNIEMSEKQINSYLITFNQKESDNITLEIEFINDLLKENFDRNVLISYISLKKF